MMEFDDEELEQQEVVGSNKKEKMCRHRGLKNFGFVCLGAFLSVGITIGAVAAAGFAVKLKNVEQMAGQPAGSLFKETYQDYSIYQFISALATGKIQIDSMESINNITPLVQNNLDSYLKQLGLTNEDIKALAAVKFEDYGEKIVPLIEEAIELEAVIEKGTLADDLRNAVCYYTTTSSTQGKFTLKNIVDNRIYQNDHPKYTVDPTTKLPTTDYLLTVVKDVKVSTFVDTSGDLKFLEGKTIGELEHLLDTLTVKDLIKIDENSSFVLKALKDAKLTQEGIEKAFKENLKLNDIVKDTSEKSQYCLYRTVFSPYEYSNEDKSSDLLWEKNPDVVFLLHTLSLKDVPLADLDVIFTTLTLQEVIPGAADSPLLGELAYQPISTLTADSFKDIKIINAFGDDIFGAGKTHVASNIKGVWKYLLLEDATEFEYAKDSSHDTYPYKFKEYTLDSMSQMITNVTANMNRAPLKDLYNDKIVSFDPTILTKTVPAIVPTYGGKIVGDLTIAEFVIVANYIIA